MSHYKSNLRDIEFNLFEVLGRDEVLGTGPFAEIDGETAREILAEVDRLAREDLAASFEDADRNPPVFDPETHTAPLPESFKKSYQAWMDAEYWRLARSAASSAAPRPPRALIWALGELVLGANAADLDVRRRPDVRRRRPPQRQRARQEDRPAHRRPRLGHHDGAHRARRRLRRRRRPHQGHRRTTTAPGTSRASSASSPRPRAT